MIDDVLSIPENIGNLLSALTHIDNGDKEYHVMILCERNSFFFIEDNYRSPIFYFFIFLTQVKQLFFSFLLKQ